MSIPLIARIGANKVVELETMMHIIIRRYPATVPKLIDETKRNYIFLRDNVKYTIPKKVIKKEMELIQ